VSGGTKEVVKMDRRVRILHTVQKDSYDDYGNRKTRSKSRKANEKDALVGTEMLLKP
jgi:hypothetical protein